VKHLGDLFVKPSKRTSRNNRLRKRILDVMSPDELVTTRQVYERLYYDDKNSKRMLGSLVSLSMIMDRTPEIRRVGKKRNDRRWVLADNYTGD
tara:strand:- start:25 stop:303 length:279 start_codon:yes stop_codon:yes gene_type:complete